MRYTCATDNFNEKTVKPDKFIDMAEILRNRDSWMNAIRKKNDKLISEFKRLLQKEDVYLEVRDVIAEIVMSYSYDMGEYYSNAICIIYEPIDSKSEKRIANHLQYIMNRKMIIPRRIHVIMSGKIRVEF